MRGIWEPVKFVLGILRGDAALTGPRFVNIDLTRRCNLHCIGCHYHGPSATRHAPGDHTIRDIPLPVIERFARDLKSAGTRHAHLGGEGEPLLHPDIGAIVRTLRSAGLWVSLISNGTLLNDKLISELLECGLDELRVSLWAGSREEYALNYAGTPPDYFTRVTDGMRRLVRARAGLGRGAPAVVMHRVITRHNMPSLEQMIDLARDIGCDSISLSPLIVPRGAQMPFGLDDGMLADVCAAMRRMKQRLADLPLAHTLGHNIDETLARYRRGRAVWEHAPCYLPWYHARVKVDGTVLPCGACDVAMGNLNQSTWGQIWNGRAFRAIRRRTSTRAGLAQLGGEFSSACDCAHCCFAQNNIRLHRILRWLPRRRWAP